MKNNVSRETLLILEKYRALLLKWNNKINLISKSSAGDIWERHILDSLQLMDYVSEEDVVIDVGSGSGLPGIVLSIAGVKNVILVESDSRKCAFLSEAAGLSPNKVVIINKRVEDCDNLECDVLVARGFSGLTKIFDSTDGVNIKKKYLLLKGENVMEEIYSAEKDRLFSYILHDSITKSGAKIVEVAACPQKLYR